jgi:pimeloyl-ACP methyl ester carboxylesterase
VIDQCTSSIDGLGWVFRHRRVQVRPAEIRSAPAPWKLFRFENSGHGLFIEDREKFNRELIVFID